MFLTIVFLTDLTILSQAPPIWGDAGDMKDHFVIESVKDWAKTLLLSTCNIAFQFFENPFKINAIIAIDDIRLTLSVYTIPLVLLHMLSLRPIFFLCVFQV